MRAISQLILLFGCAEMLAFMRKRGGRAFSLLLFGLLCLKHWMLEWLVVEDIYHMVLLLAMIPCVINAWTQLISPIGALVPVWFLGEKRIEFLFFGLLREKYLLIAELVLPFILALQVINEQRYGRFLAWWRHFGEQGELPDIALAPAWYLDHYQEVALLLPVLSFLCLCVLNGQEWRLYKEKPIQQRQELQFNTVRAAK